MDRTTTLMPALMLALALSAPASFAGTSATASGAPVSPSSSLPHMHGAPGDAACPVWQDGTGAGGPGGPGGEWLSRLQDLGLSAEQRQAMSDVAERYRTRGMDLAQRASGIREQMMNIPPDDPGYASATEKSSETAALLAADAVRLLSELRAEVHALLTDEQRQRLKEQSQQERKRWDDWRARHKAPQ